MIPVRNLVVILTKENVARLHRTLNAFPRGPYTTMLLDDSLSNENRWLGRNLCEHLGFQYHGCTEQLSWLEQVDCLRSFVRQLGSVGWNLGHNRNYALLYAASNKYDAILMVDNDILFPLPDGPEQLLEATKQLPFVGTTITGMPDHSIIGHLTRATGHSLSQYVSGSCLAVRIECVSHFFMNHYNEDWIWLCLENEGRMIPQVGTVKQLAYDPFANLRQRALFQEFGEILWEGVRLGHENSSCTNLTEPRLWAKALDLRRQDLDQLSSAQLPQYLAGVRDVLLPVLAALHERLRPSVFTRHWARYYDRLPAWRTILQQLREAS